MTTVIYGTLDPPSESKGRAFGYMGLSFSKTVTGFLFYSLVYSLRTVSEGLCDSWLVPGCDGTREPEYAAHASE